jgi:hypothetical protein
MDIRLEPSPRARYGNRLQNIMVDGVQWGIVYLNNRHYYFQQEGDGDVTEDGPYPKKGPRPRGDRRITIPWTADDDQILRKVRELIDARLLVDPAPIKAANEEAARRPLGAGPFFVRRTNASTDNHASRGQTGQVSQDV